jgi:transposase
VPGGASRPGAAIFAWHRHRQRCDALDRGLKDNPRRLGSEASFASLCGVAPIEASSGKVVRHRLNRGGNREANRALYMVCLSRMRRDQRTQEYVARRTQEGKSKREIIRCLKRYVAREVYRVLVPAASPIRP